MRFEETPVAGAYVVDLAPRHDHRGFFAREWCAEEFGAHGLATSMVQGNTAYNEQRGTLRGLHYQEAPHQEAKLIRCRAGSIFDVIVDVRPASSSYLRWFGIELSATNRRGLYVPEGCAHGYLTLTDAAEVSYLVSEPYRPGAEGGLRYDDPAIGIEWPPVPVVSISDKDRSWPLVTSSLEQP